MERSRIAAVGRRRLVALMLATATVATDTAVPMQAANAAESATARVEALVKAMTRDEKLQLVHGFFPPMVQRKPDAPADMVIGAGHIPGIPRLGIPALRETDASLGVSNVTEIRKGDVATALPAGLATAASFDPAIAYEGGVMIGSEARAKRFNVMLAGGVNLARDPWNGRNFEYLGEDPLLAGILAGEAIRGIQSNHLVSTTKHFALNAQETGRNVLDARIDEGALRESDLLAFQIAIERGRPGSIMCAYNKVNGDWACENRFLLTDVLRRDWGYQGWVMSDWGAVHSTEKPVLAGLDQESGQELDAQIFFGKPLAAAIDSGRVPAARLDEMVKRILTGMAENGLLDHPVPDQPQPIDYDANAAVAQKAAEAGIVLLRNEGSILPLAKNAKRIVLIGGHADVGVLSGGGSAQVRSVGGTPVEVPLTSGAGAGWVRMTYHASSPLRALRAAIPDAEITYIDGSDPNAAAAAARAADMAIVFATQWHTEAQDVETLALPDNQDALIEAVAAANRRSVVVLETGGPVLMPWLDRVGAVVQAWYPGQRGGEAIARVLTGAVNPSGRLPITFPRDASQAPRPEPVGLAQVKAAEAAAAAKGPGTKPDIASFPVDYVEGSEVGYRWYEAKARKPLFPFGYGLSYTRFAYANLAVDGSDTVTVSFDVTNTGDRAGADVPQLYVQGPDGRTSRLAGWQRIELRPGETRRLTVAAEPRILANWHAATGAWRISPGRYKVAVGRHAGDRTLESAVTLAERRLKP